MEKGLQTRTILDGRKVTLATTACHWTISCIPLLGRRRKSEMLERKNAAMIQCWNAGIANAVFLLLQNIFVLVIIPSLRLCILRIFSLVVQMQESHQLNKSITLLHSLISYVNHVMSHVRSYRIKKIIIIIIISQWPTRSSHANTKNVTFVTQNVNLTVCLWICEKHTIGETYLQKASS